MKEQELSTALIRSPDLSECCIVELSGLIYGKMWLKKGLVAAFPK